MLCRGRRNWSPRAPGSSPAPDRRSPGPLTPSGVALLAVMVIVIDQASKHWAVNSLAGGRIVDLPGSLRFALGYNSGFAFGTAEGLGRWIAIVAIVVIGVLVTSALRASGPLSSTGLVLIAAGAAGNVTDRLFRGEGGLSGKVVDFIDLQWWPVFNVADSAITVGALLVVVASFRESGEKPGPAS